MKAAIIINCSASQNSALKKWKAIESTVHDALPFEATVQYTNNTQDVHELLPHLLHKKYKIFIGGGGDGTISYLLNQLIRLTDGDLDDIMLGGIGLGSSNDFHKPIRKQIRNVPVRLDFKNPRKHDIGQLEYTDDSGSIQKVFFLLNSSLGLTATANLFFNSPNRTLAFLKKRSASLAIVYAAIHTLFHYKPLRLLEDSFNDLKFSQLNNLSVVKSPYLSGSFCYPELVKPDDQKFAVYYCCGMSRWGMVRTMAGMTKQKFDDTQKRGKFTSKKIDFKANEPVYIETDGEIFTGSNPRYSIFRSRVSIAGSYY